MKTKFLGLLAAGLLAGPIAANALTVTFPSTPQPFVLNFNLTGASPTQPYSQLYFNFNPVSSVNGSFYCAIFGDFDGGGGSAGGCAFALFSSGGDFAFNPTASALDGLFSVKFSGPATFTVVDPCVVGISASGARTSCVAGTIPSVPEPGTLALLGLGLAGLGMSRRRKAS